MHVLTNAEKLIPLRDAASLAESRRLAGMRMVTGTTSPSTRYERISVSPASCSIKSEYVIASHAFKPQYKCINYTPAWEQRKFSELASLRRGLTYSPADIRPYGQGIRVLRSSNIDEDEFTLSNEDVFVDETVVGIELVQEGEILITAANGSPRLVGKRAIINGLTGKTVHGGFMLCAHAEQPDYVAALMGSRWYQHFLATGVAGGNGSIGNLDKAALEDEFAFVPSIEEQELIGVLFSRLDGLITLHQRKRESRIIRVRSFIWLAGDISGIGVSAYQPEREDRMTEGNTNAETLFCDYYEQWISVYKEGAIREVTMKKYRLTQAWLGRLIPDLKLADMDRVNYQKLINGYAEHHERQTTMDFHHQLKGAILDAVDEGLIQRDPTRKAIIKGKPPCSKKTKYLNQFELHAVLADLELGKGPSWDWLILLVAKTGLRFSEALGLTPDDFDFVHQTLSVSKTWDYKNGGGFVPTKNASSVRKVQLDWQLIMQLSTLLKDLPAGDPIFVNGKVYNSTANNILARHCERANVPVISIHGLRHTHASLLLFAGVSIASVSKRLGHASMNTTQDTYLHVIRELENKDVDIVMRALSTLI